MCMCLFAYEWARVPGTLVLQYLILLAICQLSIQSMKIRIYMVPVVFTLKIGKVIDDAHIFKV